MSQAFRITECPAKTVWQGFQMLLDSISCWTAGRWMQWYCLGKEAEVRRTPRWTRKPMHATCCSWDVDGYPGLNNLHGQATRRSSVAIRVYALQRSAKAPMSRPNPWSFFITIHDYLHLPPLTLQTWNAACHCDIWRLQVKNGTGMLGSILDAE